MSDTIVALATPLGRSGIGVIRLSGTSSLQIVRKLSKDENFSPEPRTASLKKIFDVDSGEMLDETIITYFKSPESFTGEDVIEISCHGSPIILRRTIDLCLKLDARMAEPGEFSLRALSNGRLNLAQAEAIRDLINAQTIASARQSLRQLKGEFSNQLQPLKDDLLNIIVVLESALEFVEDDLPDFQTNAIKTKLTELSEKIKKLASTFQAGKLLREGLKVALIGRPNVGKSSLFNVLLGQERAIVTDVAGTTRDQLHEQLTINDIPISLIDTAGLRETADMIESIGVERSKRIMADADLVIVMLDASADLTVEDKEILDFVREFNSMIVFNKMDLVQGKLKTNEHLKNAFKISAKTGFGIDEFQTAITDQFMPSDFENSGFLVSDSRHFDLLNRAEIEINNSISLIEERMSEEIILIGLHNALIFLGQITGETTNEDMLTRIFSTFCIGK